MASNRLPGRFKAAWADLVVWTVIWLVVGLATDKLARVGLQVPSPTGPDPQIVAIVSFAFAALCANVYLAISAAAGRSVGKALFGLRLVVAGQRGKPGLARGLVRSSLQAGPYFGALMVLSGAHDAFAGTQIVADEEGGNERARSGSDLPAAGPQVARWKVGAAIALHLFFAFVYMVIGAL